MKKTTKSFPLRHKECLQRLIRLHAETFGDHDLARSAKNLAMRMLQRNRDAPISLKRDGALRSSVQVPTLLPLPGSRANVVPFAGLLFEGFVPQAELGAQGFGKRGS